MSDTIRKLTHTAAEVDDNIDEVVAARGTYDSLDERLDGIEGDVSDLETASAEDRAALAELVDGGAKNKIQFDEIGTSSTHGSTYTANGVTFTLNSDNTVTAERVSSSESTATCNLRFGSGSLYVDSLCDGNHVLSGCPSGGSATTYSMQVGRDPYFKIDYGDGVLLTNPSPTTNVYITMTVRSGFTGSITFKPMICVKSAWDISHEYVPYRPSEDEQNAQIAQNTSDIATYNPYVTSGATALATNNDLDNMTTPGIYTCNSGTIASSLGHCPYTASGFRMDVIRTSSANFRKQILQPNQMQNDSAIYERSYSVTSGSFTSWYKFEGVPVT